MSMPRPLHPHRAIACSALALLALACTGESGKATGNAPPASAGERIVVMAPGAAETLAALGLADRVVGVGDFVTYPPALAARPRLGAYDAPDVERLLGLGTTLYVTALSEAGAAARARLEALGVEVLALDTATYDGTLAGIERLGERLGARPGAEALTAGIRLRVEAVRRGAAALPRRRVLCAVGRDPLYAAGPGSHLDELLRAAGGENVLADAGAPYVLASLEAVLARRPEVIVDLSDNRAGAPRGAVAGDWGRWPFLPAVVDARVYQVDPVRLAIPGPRLAEMAELLARAIHPERFGAPRDEEMGSLAPAGTQAGGE
jgi:iron complex transport system substrate-binding protein